MKIRCLYDKLVSIEEVRPQPLNPNRHPEEQILKIQKLLDFYGWRKPLIISNQTNCLVTGHARLEAAKKNKWTHVPVDYQDFESWDEEYGYLVADNSADDESYLDLSSINSQLENIGPMDIDLLGIKDFVLCTSEKNNNTLPCPTCGRRTKATTQ